MPKKVENPLLCFTVRISPQTREELERLSQETSVPPSRLAREALERSLEIKKSA